ncbi:MAG TPA: hypothetical protein PK228_13010 [Saprospiraceae bacterium]|nr:hypothetical protein [Saprospiraceae bacterium]
MNDAISVLSELLERPVAYHAVLAKALGSVPAAVILSQGVYWAKKAPAEKQGWFWVTAEEWYNQTGVSEESQLTARKILKQAGFWEEKLIGLPAKMHYKIDFESLVAVISGYLKTGKPVTVDNRRKKPDNARASSGKFRQLDDGKNGDKKTTIEILDETKAETTVSAAVAPDTGSTVLVIETVAVEDGKNGTASMGRGPQTKSWTRLAAEVFDEVAAEKSRQNHIDYQPFNWDVCQEENFRQLKNLRDKAIVPDFKKKFNKEPTDEQMTNSFRAVFRLAWDYFYKIQKDTGGALHYTPTSVYKSYNNIKTTAQNGNINGTTKINGTGANRFGQGVDHNGTFDPKRGY